MPKSELFFCGDCVPCRQDPGIWDYHFEACEVRGACIPPDNEIECKPNLCNFIEGIHIGWTASAQPPVELRRRATEHGGVDRFEFYVDNCPDEGETGVPDAVSTAVTETITCGLGPQIDREALFGCDAGEICVNDLEDHLICVRVVAADGFVLATGYICPDGRDVEAECSGSSSSGSGSGNGSGSSSSSSSKSSSSGSSGSGDGNPSSSSSGRSSSSSSKSSSSGSGSGNPPPSSSSKGSSSGSAGSGSSSGTASSGSSGSSGSASGNPSSGSSSEAPNPCDSITPPDVQVGECVDGMVTLTITLTAFECAGESSYEFVWAGGGIVLPNPPAEPVEIEIPCTPGEPIETSIYANCGEFAMCGWHATYTPL